MIGELGGILLRYAGNVVAVSISIFTVYIFLNFKDKYKKNIAIFLLVYFVLFLPGKLFSQYFIFDFITATYIKFFIYILFKGNLIHKIFAFWISSSINYAMEVFLISFASMGFDGNLFFDTIQDKDSGNWVTFIKLILFALIYILLKNFASNKTLKISVLSKAQTLILMVLPAFGYITIFLLDWGVREYVAVPISISLFLLIASSGTLLYNAVVMILIDRLILNRKYKQMNELSQSQLLIQFNHYEAIKEKTEQTRKLKHDMKNHLLCISHLIENHEIDEAKQLLAEMKNSMDSLEMEISSGNSIADAILNEKSKWAKALGIRFEFSGALPKEDFINPFDISTIFSNALDNAIEAAKKCSDSNRYVKISIYAQGNCLFISFENSVESTIKIVGNEISTSKTDHEQHGFGLKNIQDSVKKYQGDFSINCCENIFKLEILFKISG